MLWIIGKIFSDFQEYLENHHISYGVFADTTTPLSLPAKVPVVKIDFSSKDAALTSLRASAFSPEVSGIMTAGYEQYVVPAAWLSEHFGVPGPSLKAAQAATNKSVMREYFHRYDPTITPAYQAVNSWEDIEEFMSRHDFPVILKPTNLMKSLFVTQNNSMDELRSNYDHMCVQLPKLQKSMDTREIPGVLIEECMVGSMHTVAGFVDAAGTLQLLPQVADCITAQNIGKNDNYLFSRQLPSSLGVEQQDAVLDVARKGVAALGITCVPLHIELIYTAFGPQIIEIGARIGGYRARMYEYACGLNMYQAAIDVAQGRTPSFHATTEKSCAFLEIFPDRVGSFQGLGNQDKLRKLPSFIDVRIKRSSGEQVGPAKLGFRAVAVITLGHEDPTTVSNDISYIRECLTVKTA